AVHVAGGLTGSACPAGATAVDPQAVNRRVEGSNPSRGGEDTAGHPTRGANPSASERASLARSSCSLLTPLVTRHSVSGRAPPVAPSVRGLSHELNRQREIPLGAVVSVGIGGWTPTGVRNGGRSGGILRGRQVVLLEVESGTQSGCLMRTLLPALTLAALVA